MIITQRLHYVGNYLAAFMFVLLVLIGENNSVRLKGTWEPEEDFFLFLSKFGFQKTTSHDREHTEGFVFGNITSQMSSSFLGSNNSISTVGTLVLVPRHLFLSYYRNRSVAKNSPSEACRLMFQELDGEAYDSHCHDAGTEDFLRQVPCPVNGLCPDEDKPSNVVIDSQLTYIIQDINNARYWYLSLVACVRNISSCQWEHSSHLRSIEYDLSLVNGNPNSVNSNPFEYQFSFDKQDTVEIYLVCLVMYGFVLVPLQVYAALRQVHPITRLFTAVLVVQLVGLILDSLHLIVFSFNGVGVAWLNVLGDLFNIAAQSLFMMLLLLLAKGWAITRMILSRRILVVSIWGLYSVLMLTLYLWNMTEVDVIEDVDEFQTWPGWLTLLLRVFLCAWFLAELRRTMQFEHNSHKVQFFLQFAAASLVWFIYLPLVALVALNVSLLWRYKVILGCIYSADLLAHSFMTYMLWPERSNQYLLLANEIDLSEELDEFNEAPHVINHLHSSIENPNYIDDYDPLLKVDT